MDMIASHTWIQCSNIENNPNKHTIYVCEICDINRSMIISQGVEENLYLIVADYYLTGVGYSELEYTCNEVLMKNIL